MTWCGRFDDAESIANLILAGSPDANLEYTALRGLSAVYGNRGDTTASIATLHRAAAAPGAPDDDARRMRCMAAQISMSMGTISVDEARQVAEATLAHGLSEGDATTQCLAHQVLGLADTISGYGDRARVHLTEAVALHASARVAGESYLIPDVFLAAALLELDAIDDATAAATEARRRAEQHGTLVVLPMIHATAAGAHLYAGRWDDAIAEAEAALGVINDTGNLNFVLYCEAVLAKIAIHRGELASAQAHLTAGTQRLAEGAPSFGADWLFGTQAEYLAASGQPDAALTVAETIWAQTAHIRYFYGHRARGVFLTRLATAAGRHQLARTVTTDIEEGARRSPADSAAAAALQCRGLVERDPDLLLDAVTRYRETGRRPERAACCEDAAQLLAVANRQDEAITLLREAAAINADIDASADAARVEATLRKLGVRPARRRPIRPTVGWESLTPMETEVTRLVAEGLTNPDIGSPPVHLPTHRRNPPLSRLHQGRCRQPNPARRRTRQTDIGPVSPRPSDRTGLPSIVGGLTTPVATYPTASRNGAPTKSRHAPAEQRDRPSDLCLVVFGAVSNRPNMREARPMRFSTAWCGRKMIACV